MSVTTGAEDPCAISFVGVRLRVEHAGHWQIAFIHLSIFRMNVENRISQYSNSRDWIDTLPEHVTRVVIAADRRTCKGTKAQHRFWAVGEKAGVHLNCDSYSVIGSELASLDPKRCCYILPLPFQYIEIFRRPWTRDLIGMLGVWRITWTAGEIDDDRHAQFFRQ